MYYFNSQTNASIDFKQSNRIENFIDYFHINTILLSSQKVTTPSEDRTQNLLLSDSCSFPLLSYAEICYPTLTAVHGKF